MSTEYGRRTGLERIYLRALTELTHGDTRPHDGTRLHRAFPLGNTAAHGLVAAPTQRFVIPTTPWCRWTASPPDRACPAAQRGWSPPQPRVSSSSSSPDSARTGEAWCDQSFQPSAV